MKDKLLIVGAGGLGRVTLEHAINQYACCFIDDKEAINKEINGAKIVGKVSDLPKLFSEYKKVIISIGNNVIRKNLYEKAKKIGFEFPNLIVESAYISPFAKVGKGCIILNNATIQNGSSVGDATIINPCVEVHHDSFVGNFCCVYTNSVIRTFARVEDGIRIGSNVTVRNGTVVKNDMDDGKVV